MNTYRVSLTSPGTGYYGEFSWSYEAEQPPAQGDVIEVVSEGQPPESPWRSPMRVRVDSVDPDPPHDISVSPVPDAV